MLNKRIEIESSIVLLKCFFEENKDYIVVVVVLKATCVVKTHILTINEKKERKKEGCMEKRAKNSKFIKIQKHSSF